METITSRKNQKVQLFRALGVDRALRRERCEFLCDGEKLLAEAVAAGAEITAVMKCGGTLTLDGGIPVYEVTKELLQYMSPLENSPGPLFTVRMRKAEPAAPKGQVMVLENIQDPGNVGTVLRTAAAFGTELVVLTGQCADPYNPKTVRASMGAIFRQPFCELTLEELEERLAAWELPLYGAALHTEAVDVRAADLARAAVAVGNEGKGLSEALLSRCAGRLVIPMAEGSESLNAAVAAAVILWEMRRRRS